MSEALSISRSKVICWQESSSVKAIIKSMWHSCDTWVRGTSEIKSIRLTRWGRMNDGRLGIAYCEISLSFCRYGHPNHEPREDCVQMRAGCCDLRGRSSLYQKDATACFAGGDAFRVLRENLANSGEGRYAKKARCRRLRSSTRLRRNG